MALHKFTTPAKTDKIAVTRLVNGMRDLGWTPSAYSDGEDRIELDACMTSDRIADCLMETEDAHLFWRREYAGETFKGTMYFVFGNSPSEVLADNSQDEGLWDAQLALVEEAANLEGV